MASPLSLFQKLPEESEELEERINL